MWHVKGIGMTGDGSVDGCIHEGVLALVLAFKKGFFCGGVGDGAT